MDFKFTAGVVSMHINPLISQRGEQSIVGVRQFPEPVFVNVYGAQELIPMDRFRQPMYTGGPVRQIGLSYRLAVLGIDS